MAQEKSPFRIITEKGGFVSVCCNLPLLHLAGKDAQTTAKNLTLRLNQAFDEIYPELVKGMTEADELFAVLAKRKWSRHIYEAVKAVLETQRDIDRDLMDWQDIYFHPDFKFPIKSGSAFGENRKNKRRVKKAIQEAVRYLQSKGVDIETTIIPGRGLCYRLC